MNVIYFYGDVSNRNAAAVSYAIIHNYPTNSYMKAL